MGEAHITDIAAKVKMPRSTVQMIVDRLHEDGLMNFYVMRRYKYWVAERPDRLLENLKKRQEVIEEAMPKLDAVRREGKKNKHDDIFYTKSLGSLKTCAEATLQPILIVNSDIEIVYVNNAWQKEFGYTLDEVWGENPRILKSGETPQAIYKNMWKALMSGTLFQSSEIVDKRKDGTFLKLLTTIFPVQYGHRKFYIQILNVVGDEKSAHSLHITFINEGSEE